MWAAVKRALTWLMRKLYVICPWLDGPRVQRIDVGYEKGGLTIQGEPIPWNADAVVIDVYVWFPIPRPGAKSDFFLDVPAEPPLLPVSQQPVNAEENVRIQFRMPVPHRTARVSLFWRSSLLGQLTLPVFGREEFLRNLKMEAATLFARLGEQQVPCRTLVEGQCRGLTANALLKSPTSLLPLLDLRFMIDLNLSRTRQTFALPVTLTSGQLAARETMVSVNLPQGLRLDGEASLEWTIAGIRFAQNDVRTISEYEFRQSVYLIDSRYVYCDHYGNTGYSRYLFLQDGMCRLGPCFLIASREPGLAALHPLQVRVQYKDNDSMPTYIEQDVLITDGPSIFVPLTTTPQQFERFSAFDLYHQGEHLGQLSLCTRDVAQFTSEGGFVPPQDYPWTPVAEEELADHLRKLMEVPHPFEG
jgi:hypothetical protein